MHMCIRTVLAGAIIIALAFLATEKQHIRTHHPWEYFQTL